MQFAVRSRRRSNFDRLQNPDRMIAVTRKRKTSTHSTGGHATWGLCGIRNSVIVYDWFDPWFKMIKPRGAMLPLAPAVEVIVY
jgi:hypothetical protein